MKRGLGLAEMVHEDMKTILNEPKYNIVVALHGRKEDFISDRSYTSEELENHGITSDSLGFKSMANFQLRCNDNTSRYFNPRDISYIGF